MKFFISSTFSDLKNIRQVAINTIESLINGVTGQIAAMEYFAASPEDSKSICLEELCRSDIVIGIYLQTGRLPALRPPSGFLSSIRPRTWRSVHRRGRR